MAGRGFDAALVSLGGLLLALGAGCDRDAAATAPTASATSTAPTAEPRVPALRRAELQRDFEAVRDEDLASRQLPVRRAAVRALARMRDPRARPELRAALSDADERVVAWAAYGLGDVCPGARDATVSALVAAAAGLDRFEGKPAKDDIAAPRAIARAVGRCGNEQAEAVLASWAATTGALSIPAIDALGDVARARKRLREETLVMLLGLAEGDASRPPVDRALYPIGRVEYLTPSVIARTREVAESRLEQAGVLAVRALAHTGDDALPVLERVLKDAEQSVAARVAAARALAPHGRAGQKALSRALNEMEIEPAVSPAIHVPLAVLSHLTDVREVEQTLKELVDLAPAGDGEAATRRASWLRCSAAKLLVERRYRAPELRGCDLSVPDDERDADPLPGSIGARAIVAAVGIDAVELTGKRLETWKTYATGGDLRARQRALRQLGEHEEVKEAPAILAQAIASGRAGLVAVAATVLAGHPARGRSGKEVDEAVKKALLAQLETQPDLEARAAVIDAVAALGLAQAKPQLVELCSGPRPNLRRHAQEALATMSDEAAPRCRPKATLEVPVELEAEPVEAPLKVRFESDVGELGLTLDPSLAPVAVRRVRALVEGDFFDGVVVHRVVPGFVAQFGSPSADGYGGVTGLPALPCETSPVPFSARSVGVALAGRDTGSSQLFVTFARAAHLDGAHAWLGTADGPWESLVDGDVIVDASIDE